MRAVMPSSHCSDRLVSVAGNGARVVRELTAAGWGAFLERVPTVVPLGFLLRLLGFVASPLEAPGVCCWSGLFVSGFCL